MKIKLETLQHQTDALAAIDKSFPGMDTMSNDPNANYIYANPLIKYRYNDKANIEIKMETGTGKTYVYTRMMYELHQKYGFFKFVIAVPSPSIKEGTRSFITSDYAKQHFSEFYENTRVQLNVINAGDFSTRSGRRNFPAYLNLWRQLDRILIKLRYCWLIKGCFILSPCTVMIMIRLCLVAKLHQSRPLRQLDL